MKSLEETGHLIRPVKGEHPKLYWGQKVTDKIVENQTAGGSHVKPSSENEVVATDTDTFIGSMGDSKAKLVNALFK